MWWRERRESYSREDDKTIANFIKILERKGGRYQRTEKGNYKEHIFGLSTFLSKNWKMTEQFIFAVLRLRSKYDDINCELYKLKKHTKDIFGDSELIDLDNVWDISHSLEYGGVKGIIISKRHAEKLGKLIKKAISDSKKRGFQEGSNLLVRLAKGETSLTEFESEKENNHGET